MWRTTTVALVAVLLALSAGAALAATITCTGGLCKGTKGDDLMDGTADVDEMHGRGGRDRLAGTANDDKVYGEAGDDMLGGRYDDPHTVSYIQLTAESDDPGQDKFYGGPDEDMIFARECEVSASELSEEDKDCIASGTPARDIIDCGLGSTDFASIDKKPGVAEDVVRNCERLKWTTDENQSGCAFKPWDNANVKCITGTERDDKNLIGRNNPDARMLDNMWGKGGNDTLRGRRGIDVLQGGAGDDTLYGGPGDDVLFSDVGGNQIDGSDQIDGENGDDFIDANDETTDVISCGGGDGDWAQIDLKAPNVDEKAPGVPFRRRDLTNTGSGPEIPHDPAKAPAGCELVWDNEESLWGWGRRARRGH